MSSDVENGYTFRMGDHEITMRDSFASMLDTTQLTDCLLVCHTHLKDNKNEESSAGASHLTNGHSSPTPANTSGHQNSRRTSVANTSKTPNSVPSVEQILRTHKVILSASSDYFRSVFSSVPNTLNNGVVAVIITNVDFDDLQAIIDFIYKGQVSVGQSRIHKFLAAAQLLMIKGLMNIKLVNNDDQPIDDNSYAETELIQHLKSDNRRLEHEIRSIKDTEKMKFERMRQEIENEVKKKLEIEKSVLNEEKQRFEAEKMKFTIEKEVYEKKKKSLDFNQQQNSTSNCVNISSNKQIVVNHSTNRHSTSILIDTLTENRDNHKRESSPATKSIRGTPTKSPIITVTQTSPQKHDSSGNNSVTETEPEGRHLRKRLKMDSNEENKESTTGTDQGHNINNRMEGSEGQHMDVEEGDEDGEVYEVDFSQTQDDCQTSEVLKQTDLKNKDSPQQITSTITTTTTQTAAIVASTVAFHKASTSTVTQTTPSHQMPTRSLRRSLSSIGSASTPTQENGGGSVGHEVESVVKRRGPGRTPNWQKDESLISNTEVITDLESTPLTRGLRHKLVTQDSTPMQGIRQSATAQMYTCPYCPQVYHGTQSMQDHINGVHLNQKTQYICDYCGKVYTWRISLNKHLRTVHPNEPIPD